MQLFVTKLYSRPCIVLGIYMLAIIAVIPIARTLLDSLSFISSGAGAIGMCVVGGLLYLRHLCSYGSYRALIPHFMLFAAVVAFYLWFVVAASEWLHLPVYGLLWILLRRSLPFYPALAIGAAFGCLEEALQGLAPDRFADARDIVLNLAGLVGGMAFVEPLVYSHKQQLNQ
ncbi:MAG: hypothetical protein QY326_00945 [Bdellovibrionota bacterium]|nr:MAG: hypothetical protein QY326_00945 [Bdellovibrionota bacterium]